MGSVKGKLPMAWETAREVVGSHGLSDGEAANRLGNGQGGCWFSWAE